MLEFCPHSKYRRFTFDVANAWLYSVVIPSINAYNQIDEIELYYCHHIRERDKKIRYGGIYRSGNVMIKRPDDIVNKYLRRLKR